MGRHVFLHEVVDHPLVSGGYCFLLRLPLPLKLVRFIPPPSKAGGSSFYVLKLSGQVILFRQECLFRYIPFVPENQRE